MTAGEHTYQNYTSQLYGRSNQSANLSYGDETTSTYSEKQQPHHTGLIATVAKQPGPTLSHYQQSIPHETDPMPIDSKISRIHFIRSPQHESSTSYFSTRPSFTKVS